MSASQWLASVSEEQLYLRDKSHHRVENGVCFWRSVSTKRVITSEAFPRKSHQQPDSVVKSERTSPIPLSLPPLRRKPSERPPRFRQHPKPLIERYRTSDKNNIVRNRPRDAQPPTRNLHDLRVPFPFQPIPPDRRPNRHPGLDPPPESRQAAPVAETMRQHHGGQGAGAQEEEGRVPAEDGGVGELHDGAEEGRGEGRVRVGEGVFVKVVDVRDAEVEGRQEDDVGGRDVREEVQGREEGAEDEFFGYGALGWCHLVE